MRLSEQSVETIISMSGGYPYFIQFVCKEVFDAFIQRLDRGEEARVPVSEIEHKLDADFFAGRWARATDRQRTLLIVIAKLNNSEDEFTVQEVVEKSRQELAKPFSSSHTHQMLAALANQGWFSRTGTAGTRSPYPCSSATYSGNNCKVKISRVPVLARLGLGPTGGKALLEV